MKIVVLDGFTLSPTGDVSWEELRRLGEVTVYDRTAPDEVMARAENAEVLITNKTVLGEKEINRLPRLRYIGVLATGFNVVDIDAARAKGIVVTNIPAYSTMSVAQMVFAHLLNITQRVAHYADEVKAGEWDRCKDFTYYNTPLIELSGKTFGIVGYGNTGKAVAAIALALGMKVLLLTSKSQAQLPEGIEKAASLEKLLAESDVLSLHCPLTAENKEMMNARTLAQMKDGAILINTGRGGLLHEQDVADALASGKLAALGADVLSTEPPKADNPLLKAPRCYITPHIAWASYEARVRLMRQAVLNLQSWQQGETINNVAK